MEIKKILNNNVVESVDEHGRELIVMGRGVGFQKKKGEEIDTAIIEKVFKLPKENASHYEKIVEDMPYEHISLAGKIISYASETLGKKLNRTIYITLTDHLNYAIERKKQGVELSNELLWEIRRFYTVEYKIGLIALDMINEELGIMLSEDEAGFIAIHIVNAELDGNLMFSLKAPGIIKDIVNIVKYTFNVNFDETSIHYERFIIHLRYLIQRISTNNYYEDEDEEFAKLFFERYKEASACSKKISDYIYNKLDYRTSVEELMYLTIHIEKITNINKLKNRTID